MGTTQKPGPLRWLWYAFGGRLPDRYRAWVLHDATTRTWRWRYATRVVVRTLPLLVAGYLVLNLLPVPPWTVLLALGGTLAYILFVLLASAAEFREVRLTQHGFPPGTGRRPPDGVATVRGGRLT